MPSAESYLDAADYLARLDAIRARAASMLGYRFEFGERANAPGGTWPVRGRAEGDPSDIRGPRAYFTARDDAAAYAEMADDLVWLIRENRELADLVRSIGGGL